MNQQSFAQISQTEFDHILDEYIERTAANGGNLPIEVFVDLLLERIANNAKDTLTLSVMLRDDQLVITPDRESGDIVVCGNEILIGGHRLVFQVSHH